MYIKTIDNYKVGIVAFAEYEFSIAKKDQAGASGFDDLDTPDYVESLKQNVDYLIVLYHGGKERYRYPTPYIQHRCRKIIEKGGDLVLVQHTHCVGCEEKYKGGTIVYGQGNTLLSLGEEDDMNNNGLLVEVDLDKKNISYHVVIRDGIGIRMASDAESAMVLDGFAKRSMQIKDDSFLEREFDRFCDEMLEGYQKQSLGRIVSMLRRLRIPVSVKMFYKDYHCLNIINNLWCDILNRGLIVL